MKKLALLSILTLSLATSAQTKPVVEKQVAETSPGDDVGVPVAAASDYPDDGIYNMAGIEARPEYPGGIQKFYQFIAANVRASDAEEFQGGRVFATFVVEKDGSLADIKILRDTAGFGMAEEVTRVLKKSPKWTPGEQMGKKVRVQYSLPVNFPKPEPVEEEPASKSKKGK